MRGNLYPGICCGTCANGERTRSGKIVCPHSAMVDCRRKHDSRLCCRGFSKERQAGLTRYEYAKAKALAADLRCQKHRAGSHLFKRLYWKLVFRYWSGKVANMPLYEALEASKHNFKE